MPNSHGFTTAHYLHHPGYARAIHVTGRDTCHGRHGTCARILSSHAHAASHALAREHLPRERPPERGVARYGAGGPLAAVSVLFHGTRLLLSTGCVSRFSRVLVMFSCL